MNEPDANHSTKTAPQPLRPARQRAPHLRLIRSTVEVPKVRPGVTGPGGRAA